MSTVWKILGWTALLLLMIAATPFLLAAGFIMAIGAGW